MNQNPNNNKDELEFEIEDLSIDDNKVDINIKSSVQEITGSSSDKNFDMQEDDILDDTNNSKEDTSLSQDEDSEDLSNNSNNSNQEYEDQIPEENEGEQTEFDSGSQEEKKSLRQKAQDAKENFKEKADNIKNAPENLKNKYNDAKNKINNAKEKARQIPENLKNKKDAVKDKWNNRPKSMKEAKQRAQDGFKNAGKNIKNKATQGAKNLANKAKDGAKEGFKNSDLGQSIDKAKNAIDKGKKVAKGAKKVGKAAAKAGKAAVKAAQGLIKLFVSTLPWSAIILLIVLLLVLIIVLVYAFIPGIGGDVNEEENYSQYSKTDKKVLEKLENIFEDYPNADGTLAMSVVLYPYFDNLHSGNVTSNLVEETDKSESDEQDEDETDSDDNEDLEQEEDLIEDDPYLYPLRKSKVRKRLKKVLKSLSDSSEEDFKNYLKTEYFLKDGGYTWGYDSDILTGYNGYKDLFKAAGSRADDEFYNLIIEDIYDNKNLFVNYVFENAVCASTLIDAGQVPISELMKANILVDLKKPGCSNMKACTESYYENYLSLEEYIKGVVYEEIYGNTDLNQIAALMVAAKTFTLSRRKDSITRDSSTGSFVIPMLWSTADQDFCHVDKGCNSPDIKDHYGYERGNNDRLLHGANRGPASDEQKALYDNAWELSKDVWIINDEGEAASVAYYAGCSLGKCMDPGKFPNYKNVDFKSILAAFYTDYSISLVHGDSQTVQKVSSQVCTNSETNFTATRAKIVSFGLEQVGKIPYYEGGLATTAGFEGNDFGTEVTPDSSGRTKKGLGNIGFINFVYWSVVDDNLGNSNNIDTIISNAYEVTQDKLLMGDIGYTEDKTVAGIYAGDNRWIIEDSVSGNVIAAPDDRITKFIRPNMFEYENYNYTIRQTKPTSAEWGGAKMFIKPSVPKLMGECPWYAKNRAAEIITELYKNGSLTKKQYNTYIKRISKTAGNGFDFYPGGRADNGYKGSSNIADLKAGAFIGMSSQRSPAGKKYGHVAVVEYVSEDKIIITEGWRKKNPQTYCSSYSDFSCVEFRNKVFNSYQEFYNFYHDPNGYMLKGYLYFLED